ncbi:MAG TPA: hypothetical protein VF281_04780 [Candidatus Saccharimonadales bacterium]
MENFEEKPSLPKVEQDDLEIVYIEEIFNENHIEQWFRFAEQNPILANEILARAYKEVARGFDAGENRDQMQIRVLNTVAFSMRALQVALERRKNTKETPSNGDGDDAGQQP